MDYIYKIVAAEYFCQFSFLFYHENITKKFFITCGFESYFINLFTKKCMIRKGFTAIQKNEENRKKEIISLLLIARTKLQTTSLILERQTKKPFLLVMTCFVPFSTKCDETLKDILKKRNWSICKKVCTYSQILRQLCNVAIRERT